MIETDFDVAFVAEQALREKQVQQSYRPIIQIHKWFARRPGTLFRGLILSEFGKRPLKESFYQSNDLKGVHIADPFMGGGSPLIEANRMGAAVTGADINPMAWWIVRQAISELDLDAYLAEAGRIRAAIESEFGSYFKTKCVITGEMCDVKYFLWVRTSVCPGCSKTHDLWPGSLLAEDARHPVNVFVCQKCGELNDAVDIKNPGKCTACKTSLADTGNVKRGNATCPSCQHVYGVSDSKGISHRMFAIEYSNKENAGHKGRHFKKPDASDLKRFKEAEKGARNSDLSYVPDDEISHGDETTRLIKWGYKQWRELFNPRQLLVLNRLCELVDQVADDSIRSALATNISDLLRYQNMLCRYDTMALKSLDVFSVHGFPVGLVSCESNIIGVVNPKTGVNIGSGGWTNIISKYHDAKLYCKKPFEILKDGAKKKEIAIAGERISDLGRKTDVQCRDSAIHMARSRYDAVFTDPPYFGMVQYAELMDFCYVWLKRLLKKNHPEFRADNTRNEAELTGNKFKGRGLEHFADGISSVFKSAALSLHGEGPMAFTFHHNKLESYAPIAVAILDAGLICTAALPCPAEMGGSIHISGTGSSIIDTIFVCRKRCPNGIKVPANPFHAVEEDIKSLSGVMKVSDGDRRCIGHGRITQVAISQLRAGWDNTKTVSQRLEVVTEALLAIQNHGKPD